VGISSGATGKLELDETEFFDRLEENSTALAEVFSSEGGVAAKLTAQVQRYTGGSGILSGIEDSLKSQSDTIDSQIERKERSIETFESRLRRQFSTLEQLLSSLNDQSASFASLVPPSYQSNR
jgi:flagellar hook-associated protein 2